MWICAKDSVDSMGIAEVSQGHRKLVGNKKGSEGRYVGEVEQEGDGRDVGIVEESRDPITLEP